MVRTVPTVLYWILESLVGGLLFVVLRTLYDWETSLPVGMVAVGAFTLVTQPLFDFLTERSAARAEGRPPRTPLAVAKGTTVLRRLRQGPGFVAELLFDIAFDTFLFAGLGLAILRVTPRFLPLGLPLLMVYAYVRLLTRKERIGVRRTPA